MSSTANNHDPFLLPRPAVPALRSVPPAPAPDQRPTVVWLTGPSGAGKTTIAVQLELELHERGLLVGMLDGDDLRTGLCKDLGFSEHDRSENIRRTAETAHLMTRAGLIVIVSLISPYRASRARARALFADDEFIEVHVDTPLEIAERRDPKGLYRRARSGEIRHFTGIDSPYEAPRSPEVRLDTVLHTPRECALSVLEALVSAGRLTS